MCQDDLVAELVRLRSLVSRLRRALRAIDAYVVGSEARDRLNEAIRDDGGLDYEIH